MKRLIPLLASLLATMPSAAAITFVAAASTPSPSSSGVSSLTIDKPATVTTGDLLLAQLSIRGGSDPTFSTVPTGWTLVVRTRGTSNVTQAIYRKIATGSETSSYTWSFSPSDRAVIGMLVYRGVDTTSPVDASSGLATLSSASVTAPAVTTLGAAREVVRFYASAHGGASITVPGSITQRYATRATGAGPNGVAIIAGSTAQAAAGSSGTAVAISSSTVDSVGTTVALNPAAAVATQFKITYASTGLFCLDHTVTITTVDGSGNPITGYTGTVNLSTTTNRGTWLLSSGSGTLTDSAPDDGAASYVWNSSQSSVTLLLRYRAGAAVVKVDAVDSATSTIIDDDTQGSVSFSPSGFTVTSSVLSNPPPGTIPAFASPQTSGNTFSVHLAAYGQTPTDATCGIITSYAGSKNLNFWSSYANPSTGTVQATIDGTAIAITEGASSAQAVTFSSGQAVVTARYRDAGSLAISMKDITTGNPSLPTGIRGSTGNFVSRPADFIVSAVKRTSDAFANPAAATASGTMFIAAGRSFSATITAVDSSGATTPNFGQESSPETVKFTVTLVLPATGNAPAVSGSAGMFANGVATGTAFAWPEVGIVKLVPRVNDGDYLGAGDVVGTATGNVGRFIPDNFAVALNTPVFGTVCTSGSFTYTGQSFTYTVAPVITVTARAFGGTTTQNYTGSLFRMTNSSLTGRSYTAASGSLVTTGLSATTADPVIADSGGGIGTLTFSAGTGLSFARTNAIAPFTANISLAQNVIDLDAVAASNPVSFGGGGGIAFSTGATQRYGRLALRNAVGSELLDLPVSLVAQYYVSAAVGFVTNTADTCTSAPPIVFSGYQGSLASGETCVRDTGSPGVSGAGCAAAAPAPQRYRPVPLAGDFNLNLAAPGSGNSGAVVVTATAPAWLQYDWNAAAVGNENPSALATFGLFPGPGSRIYIREVY